MDGKKMGGRLLGDVLVMSGFLRDFSLLEDEAELFDAFRQRG